MRTLHIPILPYLRCKVNVLINVIWDKMAEMKQLLMLVLITGTALAQPLTCYIELTTSESPLTYTVVPSGGVPPYEILWQNSTGIFAEGPMATITTSGFYIATTFDATGRNNSCSVYVESSLESAVITPKLLEICAGQIARFEVIPTGTGPWTFAWTGPNKFTATIENIQVTARPEASGLYSVSVTDAFGFVSTASAQLVVLPVLTCYLTPDPVLIEAGETVTLTINPEGGIPPFNFIWWGPNGFLDTNQTATVFEEGFYIGSVTDLRGCNNSDSIYLQVVPSH